MNINERFNKLIRLLYGGNKRAFATAIGVAPTVVENIVGKRQGKPSFDVIEKVCALANINIAWLISGEGSPLIGANDVETHKPAPSSSSALEERLLIMLKEKDEKIFEQAEEIGRLKEKVAILEEEKSKLLLLPPPHAVAETAK